MKRILLSAFAVMATTVAGADEAAQDCGALGLENAYLSDLFCAELEALAEGAVMGSYRLLTFKRDSPKVSLRKVVVQASREFNRGAKRLVIALRN